MRDCEQRDFGYDPNSVYQFNNLVNQYSFNLCPDIQDSDDIFLFGDYNSNSGKISFYNFNISICDNSTKKCKSLEE